MKTSLHDKSPDKTKKTTAVRMGREVPIVNKPSCCDSGTDAKCPDKQAAVREDRASSLV
jgi:hypothetical protein